MRLVAGRAGRVLLLALAAGAVLSAFALRGLRFDHNTRSLLREDAAEDAREKDLAATFGSEDLLLIAWELEGELDAGELERLRAITAELARIPGLEETYSLASPNVQFKLGLLIRPLHSDDLARPERREAARAELLAPNPYLGTIYNEELDVLAIAGTLVPGPAAERRATLRAVRELARRYDRPGRPVHVAGVTALAVDAGEYALRDLTRIGALALAASVGLLLLLCRSWRETLVAVVATGLPPLYALAAAVLLDVPVTALGAALFPVLAVVGITGSVHLLNAYAEERGRGLAAPEAAAAAARRLAPPIALSLLTTAAAFASLQATGVPAFRDGGNIVALGMLVAVPVVLLGLPAALAWVAPAPRDTAVRRLDAPLQAVAAWTLRRARPIAVASLVLCAAGAWLAPRAHLRVDVIQAFKPESRIARTYAFLEERLTAVIPTDIVLRAREAADETEVLRELERLSEGAVALPEVPSAMSLADLVRYGQRVMRPVEIDDLQALEVLRREPFRAITSRFEDRDKGRYRVKLRIKDGAEPAVLDRLAELAGSARTGDAALTGLYVRAVGTTRRLVRDLGRGALWMGLLVVVCAALALRSWRAGLAALVPNLLPVAFVFGGAVLSGVTLDVSAVAVGAVAVGLAIDNTLHVLFRVSAERRQGATIDEALVRAQGHVGRAIVLATAVLVAGLACLAFSAFLPTARFGLFTAACCAAALPGDLVALPAFLRLLRAP